MMCVVQLMFAVTVLALSFVGINLQSLLYASCGECCGLCLCRQTLQLSRQLADRALEAQACYSLGNAYTLLGDYIQAIEYHALHLKIARELSDSVGESRACWSLSNAYRAVGENEQAVSYVLRHRDICAQVLNLYVILQLCASVQLMVLFFLLTVVVNK